MAQEGTRKRNVFSQLAWLSWQSARFLGSDFALKIESVRALGIQSIWPSKVKMKRSLFISWY